MKVLNNIILAGLFIGFTFFFGFVIFVTPDKDISDVENRKLSQLPNLQLETIANGKFTTQFQSYVTDQFYMRNQWIKEYFNWQLFTNQTYIYDYYIDNGWVYPKPFTTVDKKSVHNSADSLTELNQFTKENGMELYFFSLPDRRNMLEVDYPSSVPKSVGQSDKTMFLSLLPEKNINVVDVGEKWDYDQEDYRNFYYRTDHHWNINGAFAAYKVIRNTFYAKSSFFSDPFFNENLYGKECLTNKSFMGVYNNQLYGMMDSSKEKVCYVNFANSNTSEWKTYKNGMNEKNIVPFSSIYGKAKKMDKTSVSYADIYTSDYSEIHIINPDKSNSKSKVLFLKDSYANPLLPLVAENFYHTTFYDIRHNEGENLYDYINKHNYDIVAFLYSNGRTLDNLYEFGERP